MIVKRKLYSVIGEEGNLGYYLYDESTGEEERLYTKRNLIQALALRGKYSVRGMRKKAADSLHESAKKSKAKMRLSSSKFDKNHAIEAELLSNSPQDRQAAMNLYRKGRNMGYTATHTDVDDINKYVTGNSHLDFKTSYRNGRVTNPIDVKKNRSKALQNQIDINRSVYGRKIDPSSYILAKNLESGKNLINLEKGPITLGTVSHELGHAVNSVAENRAYKLRRNLSALPDIKSKRTGKKPGLVKATLGDLVVIGEEVKASKNATELLKEAGASSKAIKLAEISNKHAGDTYKHHAAFNLKARLRDVVDPIGKGNVYYSPKSRYAGKNGRYLVD